jgi:serine/threonine-protein kinase
MIAHADKARLEELLLRWEELHDQGQDVTVDDLCPDSPEVAAELARRIAALRVMDSLLETVRGPARDSSLQPFTTATSKGASRGREFATSRAEYRDLRFHAAGALGEVFMAHDTKLNREVALKFLKPSRGRDPESRRRFFLEAEVTSRLEHPGIVPIYALGTDSAEAPCYAMRFIRGETLQDRIDAFHAADRSNRDLSQRSLELCELLHRFVSVCNTVAYAHNRGILHRDLKPRNVMLGKYDETQLVDWGLAKPFDRDDAACVSGEERLTPTSDESGSDTPTLGVVGTLGYMSPEQGEARWDLVGPRSDIFSLGAVLYAILTGLAPYGWHTRGEIVDKVKRCEFPKPRQMNPQVPRALEAVCLKAMAREPAGRYTTALELAYDLKLWLADQPVTAWREPLSLRARRWMRRRRTLVTSTAAVLVFSLAGLSGFASVLAGKNRELGEQRNRAEQREAMAIGAVQKFRDAVQANSELKNRPELDSLRKELLKEPMEFFRKLRDQLQADRDTLPDALAKLADATLDLASTTREIGSIDDAVRLQAEVLAMRERLARDHPAVAKYQRDLAESHRELGALLTNTGRPVEAMQSLRQALAAEARLVHDNPTVAQYQSDLAKIHNNTGVLLGNVGQIADALESHQRALEIRTRLAHDNPSIARYQDELAASHYNVAVMLSQMGRTAEALESNRRALEIRARLTREDPTVTAYQIGLAAIHNNIAWLLVEAGQRAEALDAHRRAIEIRARLVHEHPSVTQFQSHLALSHFNIGDLLSQMGRPGESLEAHRRALEIRARLARDHPAVTEYQGYLAVSHNDIGSLLYDSGHAAEAAESYRQALEIQERLIAGNPSAPVFQSGLGLTLHNLAEIEMVEGRWQRAREQLERAIQHQRTALASMPRHPQYLRLFKLHLLNFVKVHQALNQPAEAIRVTRELAELANGNPTDLYNVACAFALSVPRTRGEQQQALATEAVQRLQDAVGAGWNDARKTNNDLDLSSLRDRDDFRRLLAELFDHGFPNNPFSQ